MICANLSLNVSLKNDKEIEDAIEHLISTIQQAAWESTPSPPHTRKVVKNKLKYKRKLRKRWQNSRDPRTKTKLNKVVKELKIILQDIDNSELSQYLENLSATKATDYSLWKGIKNMYHQTTFSSALKTENGD